MAPPGESPRAPHICMPTPRFGRSQREADSGGWLISWTTTHQLLATDMPCYYGAGLGGLEEEEESEETQTFSESPQDFGMIDVTNNPKFCSSSVNTIRHEQKWNVSVFPLLFFFPWSHLALALCRQRMLSHVFSDVWRGIFGEICCCGCKTHMMASLCQTVQARPFIHISEAWQRVWPGPACSLR